MLTVSESGLAPSSRYDKSSIVEDCFVFTWRSSRTDSAILIMTVHLSEAILSSISSYSDIRNRSEVRERGKDTVREGPTEFAGTLSLTTDQYRRDRVSALAPDFVNLLEYLRYLSGLSTSPNTCWRMTDQSTAEQNQYRYYYRRRRLNEYLPVLRRIASFWTTLGSLDNLTTSVTACSKPAQGASPCFIPPRLRSSAIVLAQCQAFRLAFRALTTFRAWPSTGLFRFWKAGAGLCMTEAGAKA